MKIQRLLSWLFISLFIMSNIHEVNAGTTVAKPDFAFPQKVSTQADKDLKSALRDGNGPLILRSLMNYGLAQGLVDADNLPDVITRIQKLRADSHTPAVAKSMLALLQATVYQQIYQQNRWTYERRDLPLTPLPADYTEWSGKQFKARIEGLIDTSLMTADQLQHTPIAEWLPVINLKDTDTRYFPTLYDFVAYRAIDMIKANGLSNVLFSINWLCRYTVYEQLKFTYASDQARRILGLYQDLLRLHADNPYALIYADVERLNFVSDYVSDREAGNTHFDLLMDMYDQHRSCDFSAYILQSASNLAAGIEQERRLYDTAGAYLKAHPEATAMVKSMNSLRARLSQQRVRASYRAMTKPGSTIPVKLNVKNAPTYAVGLFRLPASVNKRDSYYHYDGKTEAPVLVARQQISAPGAHTIFTADTTVMLTIPSVGRYVIVPLLSGTTFPKDHSAPVIRCSGIALANGTNVVMATDPVSGAPTDGVKLSLYDYRGNVVKSATTNADGLAELPRIDRVSYITGTKGSDNTSYCNYSSWYGDDNDDWEYTARIFTALPIYHPGDTVRFSSVVYRYNKTGHRVCSGMEVEATLYDANGNEVDTLKLTSDQFGRVDGSFAIPKDGLTGYFSIDISSTGKDDDTDLTEAHSFMVSDYKLPTFEIKDLKTQRGVPANGDVTITGTVATYSGFPLTDTKVTLNLSVAKRIWWSYTPDRSFYTTDTVTDADGHFEIVLPADLLADAPIADGTFTADLTALSATGESQTGFTRFTQGPAYSIVATLPNEYEISSPKLKLPVRVTDLMDNSVEQTVRYRIMRDNGEEVMTGTFQSVSPIVDWSKVPSGRYNIEFALTDSTLADPVTTSGCILYRLTDKMPPITTALWVPRKSMTGARGTRVEIPYGTTAADSHILVTVWNDQKILSRKWHTPDAGNHTLAVEVPTDGSTLNVTFATVNDYEFSQSTVKVYATDVVSSLDIQIGSFRDRIIPGDKETWTITVTDNTGTPQASAVILDMYSKAIDQLEKSNWDFYPRSYYNSWHFNWYNPAMFNMLDASAYSSYVNYRSYNVSNPDWQLYGKSFIFNRNIRIRGSRNMMMSTADMSSVKEHSEEIAVEEAEDAAYPAEKKAAMTGSVAMAAPMLYGYATSEDTLDEVVTVGYGVQTDADGGNGAAGEREEPESYRMPEMPLALFEPMLTTDAQGHLTYTFTAPNANTTWQLCAVAFTDDLFTGSLSREIISSKPVMVQPNLPRFLRTGDRAVIRASVMNNTDTVMVVNSRIDIFDPATDHIWDVKDFTDTIAPHRSATVEIEVNAPFDQPLLGYRVRSLSGRYYDGEQAAIPVLPSSTPVIETKPFYMAPDSTNLSVQLPKMPADARVTLQFCENPAWYCVTALPGLRTDDSRTALSASAAIFSAAIADGLLKSQPELARAIHYWQTSDRSDSTLTSMLEQNQDLKTVLLNATPWMMDARSQTERMTRLALLFDRKDIKAAYDTNIRLLAKLQRGKGGWGWIEQSAEPSEWITYNVLGMMGRLRQLGWLPDNKELRSMIDNAVAYIDDCAARDFVKYPKSDYSQYVMTRDYFPNLQQPSTAKRVTTATVQRLISDWKDQSAPVKAISALILNNHGYNATARKALESLREYSKTTDARGMWWPSLDDYTVWSMGKISATSIILDAFNAVEPGCADVDRIRQWLILQKEAKDWGTSVTTADVIASILTSGSRWTVPAHGAEIKVGNVAIEPTRTDAMTGYFRTDISRMQPSGATLTIAKAPAGPAWGAVYSQYTGVMAEVKAQASEAVSIEKQMLVQRATPDGAVWEPASEIKVGDRIKVQLTIRSTRDMDYVAIIDDRAAALEPTEQLPTPLYSEGLCFYRENRDSSTRMFVTHMPKGTYLLTYELFANNSGTYASGIASLQSQYAPQLAAHSSGSILTVSE